MITVRLGDVVQLKSGGDYMTVCKIEYQGQQLVATCIWFDRTGTLKNLLIGYGQLCAIVRKPLECECCSPLNQVALLEKVSDKITQN